MIIAFSGPDGAGKTTLAKMLARYLVKRKHQVSYIRFKSHHLAMYLLLRLLQKLKLIPSTNSPRILDYSLKKYFSQSKLLVYLELANAILWLLLNINLRRIISRKVIIAERYIPDFIVSMLLIAPNKNLLYQLIKILKPWTHGTVKIFLYANPTNILYRKKDEQLTTKYVNILLRLYSLVSSLIGADSYINTSRYNTMGTFQQVKKLIDSKYLLAVERRNWRNTPNLVRD